MKSLLKKILSPVFYLFIEKNSYISFEKSPNLLKLAFYSLKYKCAARGIFLSDNERKLFSLKDKYKGKRCFIIGNGPSLNALDLKKLKGEYTFGVNAIYLNYENMGFYPTFYVIEDYLVAEDRADEINKYDKSQYKFFGSYLDYVLKKDQKSIVMNVQFNYQDEVYEPKFSHNMLRTVGVGGSVTFICLQLAYYLGFDKVYMIGFDHSYSIPKDASVVDKVIESKSDDVNHFSAAYFGKGYRWHDPRVDRMELGFTVAKEAFEKDGREVYNATKGGKLEVFERVDYDTLF